MTINDDDKPARRGGGGKARMRALNAAAEAERSALEIALFAGLGRTPSAVDAIAIETLSSAVISARRKRAAGKSDTEALKLICQLLRATGLRPAPTTAPTGPSLQDTLDAIAAEAAAAEDDE